MADTKSTFFKRVVSGLAGAILILGTAYFIGQRGLQFICVAATVLAIREYSRMVFPNYQMPKTVAWSYWVICVALYVAMYREFAWALMEFGTANVLYMSLALWLSRDKVSNENLLPG